MHIYPKGAGVSLSLISSLSFFTTHPCHSMVPHFTDGEMEAEAKGTGRLGGECLEQTWGGGCLEDALILVTASHSTRIPNPGRLASVFAGSSVDLK